MIKSVKTLILVCSVLLHTGTPAQVFPVRVVAQLSPPYSPYLSDYTTPGSQTFMIQVWMNDLAVTDYHCKLRLTIEGVGITLRTKPTYALQPLILQGGGEPQILYGEDLREYFHPNALDFSGLSRAQYEKNARLPEGVYRFSIEVLDYNRGVVVSNRASAVAWIVLNDPPMLNMPANFSKVKITGSDNILFTWTPRHSASPNAAFTTEYTFRLIELWPQQRNAPDAFQSMTPLYQATTAQTQVLYGLNEPALLPGRTYAWQVQARDAAGRDLFKNSGCSEVFVFQYGEALPIPANLRLRWAKPTTLAIQWDPVARNDEQVRYRLQYRPRRRSENHEWYETWTRFTDKTLYHLQTNTEYEMKIRSENALQEGEYSDIRIFKTLREEVEAFVCREEVEPPPLPANTLPVFPLAVNDTIHAGGYDVLVRDVIKVENKYYGSGLAIVPWFNDAKVRVTFEKIGVNDQFWLTSGTIKSVWNSESSFQIKEETPLKPGHAPRAGELDITLVTVDSLITVSGTTLVSVTEDELGNIAVLTSDGKEQTVARGGSYAIVDEAGNGYVIDDKGNIAKTTASEAKATAARGDRSYDLTLRFLKGRANFGFDEKKYEGLSQFYQQVDDGTYIPWKALSSARPDLIEASLSSGDVRLSDITFVAGTTPLTPTSTEAGKISLTVQGKAGGLEEELLAVFTSGDTLPPKVLGKLNLVTYNPIRFNLEIVPVNGALIPGALDEQTMSGIVNSIYSQAVVEWTLHLGGNLTVPLPESFDEGETSVFSNYTGDMKKVLDAYGPLSDNTYYLFVIQEPRNQSTLGYMPRNRRAGFVFSGPHQNNPKEFLKTIAHELGHGAFNLKHTFVEHNLPAGITDNLMDYSDGTALYKYQWDYLHEPRTILGLFEGGEEREVVGPDRQNLFNRAAPLLQESDIRQWVEKVRRVYEFLEACRNEGWQSYNGKGIVPYCFWRDYATPSLLTYTNLDLPFTAGLIDGGYVELEGFYLLPDVLHDISRLPGKIVYAYTRAYLDCRMEKMFSSIEDYQYVVDELARMEAEGGLWNWVKEQLYDYKDQKQELLQYFLDCREAAEVRQTIDDLYELVINWEEIKILSGYLYSNLKTYWETLQEEDNHGRYERGYLVIPTASVFLPLGAGVASKAEKLKAVLKTLREASKENLQKVAKRIGEVVSKGHSPAIDISGKIADESELGVLANRIKYLPGPQLPPRIAASFTNSSYENRKLITSERFFKYHGVNNRTGRKYTWVVRKKYTSEDELRRGVAIRHDWNVDIKYVSEFDVPSGTWVSEGTAASQGIGYPGGDYQAVILKVPKTWIVKTTDAF